MDHQSFWIFEFIYFYQ